MDNIRKARHDDVPPLIDDSCHTLVLGSMLSPKSAEKKFYYAHPQNRFWKVLAAVFGEPVPISFADCAMLALSNGIALWDVIASCDIIGARDETITNVIYNDVAGLLEAHRNIKRVFATGGKAYELLLKYNAAVSNTVIANAIRLPSTSPQNFGCSLSKLIDAYRILNVET